MLSTNILHYTFSYPTIEHVDCTAENIGQIGFLKAAGFDISCESSYRLSVHGAAQIRSEKGWVHTTPSSAQFLTAFDFYLGL